MAPAGPELVWKPPASQRTARMFRKHLAASLLLLLAACAAPQPHVTVNDDQFSKQIEIFGWGNYENPFGGIFRQWRLRSFVDKQTHQVTHQIYVELHYDDEYQYFISAADDTARSLVVLVLDRSSMCRSSDCTHFETIGVAIDDATLRARAAQGFRIKVSAQRGSEVIMTLSPTQIGLQLAAADRLIHLPAAAPSPSPSGK
jgi:hypothetical protein